MDFSDARKRTVRVTNILGYFAIKTITDRFVFRMSRLRR